MNMRSYTANEEVLIIEDENAWIKSDVTVQLEDRANPIPESPSVPFSRQ